MHWTIQTQVMFIMARSAENTTTLLSRHLLCQRQKPTSIYTKTMISTSKPADETCIYIYVIFL